MELTGTGACQPCDATRSVKPKKPMLNPPNRKQMAHVLEIALVLVVIAGSALGLNFLADFCQTRHQPLWLGQAARVVAMYLFFVDAVIFCSAIAIVGIRLIRNLGNRDAA